MQTYISPLEIGHNCVIHLSGSCSVIDWASSYCQVSKTVQVILLEFFHPRARGCCVSCQSCTPQNIALVDISLCLSLNPCLSYPSLHAVEVWGAASTDLDKFVPLRKAPRGSGH